MIDQETKVQIVKLKEFFDRTSAFEAKTHGHSDSLGDYRLYLEEIIEYLNVYDYNAKEIVEDIANPNTNKYLETTLNEKYEPAWQDKLKYFKMDLGL